MGKNGCEVKIRKGEDTESLIKRFNKKSRKSGIVEEFLEKRFHKKGSQKKRRQ